MRDAFDEAVRRRDELLARMGDVGLGGQGFDELFDEWQMQCQVIRAMDNHDPVRYVISAGDRSVVRECAWDEASWDNVLGDAYRTLLGWLDEDSGVDGCDVTQFTNARAENDHVRTTVTRYRVGLDGRCDCVASDDPDEVGPCIWFALGDGE